jgi:hypothetical protein
MGAHGLHQPRPLLGEIRRAWGVTCRVNGNRQRPEGKQNAPENPPRKASHGRSFGTSITVYDMGTRLP